MIYIYIYIYIHINTHIHRHHHHCPLRRFLPGGGIPTILCLVKCAWVLAPEKKRNRTTYETHRML